MPSAPGFWRGLYDVTVAGTASGVVGMLARSGDNPEAAMYIDPTEAAAESQEIQAGATAAQQSVFNTLALGPGSADQAQNYQIGTYTGIGANLALGGYGLIRGGLSLACLAVEAPMLGTLEAPVANAFAAGGGEIAGDAADFSEDSIMQALRQAGTPESLATSKLLSTGRVNLNILDTDPSGRGLGGLYEFGSNSVTIYADASSSAEEAAGYVTHEMTHYMQDLRRKHMTLVMR